MDDTDHAGDRKASQHPLDRIFERYASRKDEGGYTFVPNLERIEKSVLFAPGVVLRAATAEEADELREAVDYFVPSFGRWRRYPWEVRAVRTPIENGFQSRAEPLNADTHRYHVLVHEGSNLLAHDVFAASVLASGPEFVHGFDVSWGPIQGAGSGRHLQAFVESVDHDDSGFGTLSEADVVDLVDVVPRVAVLPPSHPLRTTIGEHSSLRTLGNHVRLRLLGRFSILESLIVHKPNDSDPYDSITRQVKTKMVLLDRRFARPVRYEQFVEPTMGRENLWKALYSLRSAIAHGNPPTFDKGPFAALKSLENADRLVASAVRSVLRQMLEEEHLLADLRAC